MNRLMKLGRMGEENVSNWFKKNRIDLVECGQESLHPEWAMQKLKKCRDDDILLVRHWPDFYSNELKCYINAKHAPNGHYWGTLTLQRDSIIAAKRLSKINIDVLVLWSIASGDNRNGVFHPATIVGQLAPKINLRKCKFIDPGVTGKSVNGSNTPFYRVPISQLKPVTMLINHVRNPSPTAFVCKKAAK